MTAADKGSKGYQSVVALNTKWKQGSVMVRVKPHTLVIVEANQIAGQSGLTDLAGHVPLHALQRRWTESLTG